MAVGSQNSSGQSGVKNRYDEIFEVEVDGWCYGISHFPGEVHAALVHRVIKELSPAFREAVESNYAFNVLDLSTRISRAAKYLVPEKEVTFAILYQLPNPADFGEEAQLIIAKMVDKIENAYPGALEKIQRKWRAELKKRAQAAAASKEVSKVPSGVAASGNTLASDGSSSVNVSSSAIAESDVNAPASNGQQVLQAAIQAAIRSAIQTPSAQEGSSVPPSTEPPPGTGPRRQLSRAKAA